MLLILSSCFHTFKKVVLCVVRNNFEESLNYLNFISKLKEYLILISGALNEMTRLTSVDESDVLKKIEDRVVNFFTQVMQMDSFTLRKEALE
ncbi:MAG: hypothetical protein ACJASG_001952 [Oleiphilaceae bacterium]|jgi:hypothetical protein